MAKDAVHTNREKSDTDLVAYYVNDSLEKAFFAKLVIQGDQLSLVDIQTEETYTDADLDEQWLWLWNNQGVCFTFIGCYSLAQATESLRKQVLPYTLSPLQEGYNWVGGRDNWLWRHANGKVLIHISPQEKSFRKAVEEWFLQYRRPIQGEKFHRIFQDAVDVWKGGEQAYRGPFMLTSQDLSLVKEQYSAIFYHSDKNYTVGDMRSNIQNLLSSWFGCEKMHHAVHEKPPFSALDDPSKRYIKGPLRLEYKRPWLEVPRGYPIDASAYPVFKHGTLRLVDYYGAEVFYETLKKIRNSKGEEFWFYGFDTISSLACPPKPIEQAKQEWNIYEVGYWQPAPAKGTGYHYYFEREYEIGCWENGRYVPIYPFPRPSALAAGALPIFNTPSDSGRPSDKLKAPLQADEGDNRPRIPIQLRQFTAPPIEIFCCYARKDQQFLNELKAHLMLLQRQGLITLWADIDIDAGVEWEKEINKHLNTAQIILLLVSPDFIASEYCYGKEMQRAMERHNCGEARVIPIILRPVYWQSAPFSKLQALPKNALPVTDWLNLDRAFYDVAEGIRITAPFYVS